MAAPLVSILIASERDLPVAKRAIEVLDALQIGTSVNLVSPHRTADRLEELVKSSSAKVFLAMGDGPVLPGAIAALTMRPVVGVPIGGALPHDRLLAMAHASSGTPVGLVGTDRPEDAAMLAAAMLALGDEKVQSALAAYRERQRQVLLDADRELQGALRR